MLGRKREDQSSRGAAGARGASNKKRKWQEELSDDGSGEEKVTPAEMEAWRVSMLEEEQQEKERERRERELKKARELEEARKRQERELQRKRELDKAELEDDPPEPSENKPVPAAEASEPHSGEQREAAPAAAATALAADAQPADRDETSAAASASNPATQLDSMGHLKEDDKRQLLLQHLMQALPQSTPEYSGVTACIEETPARSFGQAAAVVGLGFQIGGSLPSLPNTNELMTIHFQVPMHRVKDILGVKGKNVKAIKQQSGVQKIGIMDGAGTDPATIEIIGMASNVEMARSMVLGIVAGDHSVIGNVVEALDIEQHLVSKLIGPKGTVISNIKDQSGAYLAVRETGGGLTPKVVMTGPPDCVARARLLVEQFLAEQRAAAAGEAAAAGQQQAWWPELGAEQVAAPLGLRPAAWQRPARPPLARPAGAEGAWRQVGWRMPAPGAAGQPLQPQAQMGGGYAAWPPQLAAGAPWG